MNLFVSNLQQHFIIKKLLMTGKRGKQLKTSMHKNYKLIKPKKLFTVLTYLGSYYKEESHKNTKRKSKSKRYNQFDYLDFRHDGCTNYIRDVMGTNCLCFSSDTITHTYTSCPQDSWPPTDYQHGITASLFAMKYGPRDREKWL